MLRAVPPCTCPGCGEIHYVNPKPCGNAVLVRGAGAAAEVLLALRARAPDADTWTVPGGFCEAGEHPRDAAVRELGEETGVSGRAVAYLGTWMDVYGPPAPDGLQITTSVSGYLCEAAGSGALGGFDPAEVRELAWFPREALPGALAFPAHVPAMIAAGFALVDAATAGVPLPLMFDARA